ncbi:MAG: ABC transporter transmembrane domain-containing protein, partial [Cellulosilyticaceae bacterium]
MKALLMSRKASFMRYLIACFFPVIDTLAMQVIFAMVFICMEKKDMMYFRLTIALCVGCILLGAGLHIASRLMRIGFMRDILLDIRKQAFDKILNISYKEFSKESKDVYISHLVNDINTFENNFFLNLLNVIFMGGRYVTSAIIICVFDWQLGVAMLALSVVMFGLGSLFAKKTEEMQLKVTEANEKLTVQASNTFNGLEILKLSGVEEKFLDKNLHTINKAENKKMGLSVYTELQRGFMMTLSYSIMIGLIVYMLTKVLQGGSFGIEMFLFQLCNSMIFPLIEIIPRVNVVKSSVRIYEKITKYDTKGQEETKEAIPFTFDEQLEVRNLKFAYEGNTLFKGANFTLEKGKKYVIKGASGCGKSTLMKILAMIHDTYEGDIVVDGKNYGDISDKSFNDQV